METWEEIRKMTQHGWQGLSSAGPEITKKGPREQRTASSSSKEYSTRPSLQETASLDMKESEKKRNKRDERGQTSVTKRRQSVNREQKVVIATTDPRRVSVLFSSRVGLFQTRIVPRKALPLYPKCGKSHEMCWMSRR